MRVHLCLLLILTAIPGLAGATNIDVSDGKVTDWKDVKLFSDARGDAGADVTNVAITSKHPDHLYLRVDLASTPLLALYRFTLTYADGTSQTISWIQGGGPSISNCARNCTLSYGTGKTAANDTYVEIDIPYTLLSASFKNGKYILGMKFQSRAFSGGRLVSDLSPNAKAITYDATKDVATSAQVIAFTAEPGPSGVVVRWRTGAEVNNAGFRVSRASGSNWLAVTDRMLPGAGTAGTGSSYELLDASGRAGDRYLLEDVDEDSKATTHGPVQAVNVPHLSPLRPPVLAPVVRQAALRALGWPVPLDARASAAAVLGAAREGLYRIDPAELLAAGVDPHTALSRRLRVRGPAGDAAVMASPGAGLLFYAPPPVNAYDGLDRYRVDAQGQAPATPQPLAPLLAPPLPSFAAHLVLQERTDYDWYAPGDDAYAWLMVRSSARGLLPLTIPDPAGSGVARMTVHLQGGRDRDRAYDLVLNGTVLGTASWSGLQPHVQTLDVPASLLDPSGKDLLEIRAQADTTSDYIYVHAVELDYQRAFVARGDQLTFEVPARSGIRVRGFSRPDVVLVDVTSPQSPRLLSVAARPDVDGTYSLSFGAPGSGSVRLLAAAGDALLLPTARQAVHTLENVRGADLLVVAPRELVSALDPLLAARRAAGLTVQVATLEEIEDTYPSSQAGPDAIRALVDDALTWSPAPRWLLLAGKGSADPRGLLGSGDVEQIPTHFVVTEGFHLRAPSDAWYGLRGSTMRIAVGRIPARTSDELAAVVAKTLASERQAPSGRIVGVADGVNDGVTDGPTTLFEGEVDLLTAPFSPVTRIASRTDPAAASDLVSALDQGADLVVYSGHGWTGGWGYSDTIFSGDTARGLSNTRRPFVVTSTCWEANFSDVTGSSLAMASLLDPTGGSMASFGGTTILDLSLHGPLVQKVLEALAGGAATIGEAVQAGQNAFLASSPEGLDGLYTFPLLGDPSARSTLAHR